MDRFIVVAEVWPKSQGYNQLFDYDEISEIFEEHGYCVSKDPERECVFIMKKKEE